MINESQLEKTVGFLFTYLLRRSVCRIPTNSLRGLFAYLYNRVFRVPSNKLKYYESINKFLSTLSSRDVLPAASEFKSALQNGDLYSNLALCRFIMMDIENGNGKEVLTADNLSIEHIMPQTLSAEWSKVINAEDHAALDVD